MKTRLDDILLEENGVSKHAEIDDTTQVITIPALADEGYRSVMKLSYNNDEVRITFPQTVLTAADWKYQLPQLPSIQFSTEELATETESTPEELIIFFNNTGYVISQGQTVHPVLEASTAQDLLVSYGPADAPDTVIDVTNVDVDWANFTRSKRAVIDASTLSFETTFLTTSLDPLQNPSVNCSKPRRGMINTSRSLAGVQYVADGGAVNCNGIDFEYVSSAGEYLFYLKGENPSRRGSKFFISNSESHVVPESYLFTADTFERFILLPAISSKPFATFNLNWETRSFGEENIDVIEEMQLSTLPLETLSRIQLEKLSNSEDGFETATLSEKTSAGNLWNSWNVDCASRCIISNDQAYDRAWVAWDRETGQLLEKVRINNWANGWIVDSETDSVRITYLPEFAVVGGFAVSSILIGTLGFIWLKQAFLNS